MLTSLILTLCDTDLTPNSKTNIYKHLSSSCSTDIRNKQNNHWIIYMSYQLHNKKFKLKDLFINNTSKLNQHLLAFINRPFFKVNKIIVKNYLNGWDYESIKVRPP